MPRPQLAFVALAACLACAEASAAESYVIYDDFSSATFDPARWSAVEHTRKVEGNAMRLVQREWGATSSDSGTQFVSWSESVTRPGSMTQLRATIRVNAIDMTSCAANASPTRVRTRILGTFFNSGNRFVGSNVGDVLAQVNVLRASNSADAPGVLRVEGSVYMCGSSDCNSAGVQVGSTVNMGTVNVGANVLAQIDWDRANKRFLFSRDKGAATAVTYTVDDSASPGIDFKTVGTRVEAANCLSGPRAFGQVDARFDNVAVNATAKP